MPTRTSYTDAEVEQFAKDLTNMMLAHVLSEHDGIRDAVDRLVGRKKRVSGLNGQDEWNDSVNSLTMQVEEFLFSKLPTSGETLGVPSQRKPT